MPRTYTAVLQDGSAFTVEDVPDDVHPNDVLKQTEAHYKQPVKELIGHGRGWLGEAKEMVKDVARGGAKALAFLSEGAAAANDLERGRPGLMPDDTHSALTDAANKAIPTPANDTPGRNLGRAALEGVGGAAVSPAGMVSAPVRTVLSGGASGLGARMGGEAGGMPGALLGGLAGGSAISLAAAPKTSRNALARQTLEGVSEHDLDIAKKIMTEAKAQGINLNLSQAMPTASNIDKLTEVLAQSKNGKEIIRQLRNQPREVAFAAENELDNLPGNVREPQSIANAAQDAATGVIKDTKKARTTVVSNLYNNAGDLGTRAPKDLAATIDRFVNQEGISPKVAQEALKLQASLLEHPVKGGLTTSAGDIKAQLDSFRGGIKNNQLNPMDASEQGQMKYLVQQLYGQLGQKSPVIRAANAIYGELSENVVDPLQKSVVGRLATPQGAKPDREAARGKVFGLFDAGSTPGAPTSEILTLERSLRNGKQADTFLDTAKTWLAQKVSNATTQTGGRPSEGVASNLERAFAGNDTQKQGFKDILVGMARSQGLPDDALLPGMQNLMRYVSAAARRPSSVAGTSLNDIEQASRNRITSGIGNFSAVQPIRQPFKLLDDWLNSDAYGFMDKALTSPEGIEMLKKLGKTPIVSKSAQDTINTFLATAGAAPEKTDPNTGP